MQLLVIEENIDKLVSLAIEAGDAILDVCNTNFDVKLKSDKSPVTEADERAEEIILKGLAKISPETPVIAEESFSAGERPDVGGGLFWLVDALDGTRAFVKNLDEYTVNIALVYNQVPVLGVVHAPAIKRTFWGSKGGAFCKNDTSKKRMIKTRPFPKDGITVVTSRSQRIEERKFLDRYLLKNVLCIGSSLKLCMIAAGEADMYPRFGPTSEWDIAAGHAILSAAGGTLTNIDGSPFLYGKKNILNPHFVAKGQSI